LSVNTGDGIWWGGVGFVGNRVKLNLNWEVACVISDAILHQH